MRQFVSRQTSRYTANGKTVRLWFIDYYIGMYFNVIESLLYQTETDSPEYFRKVVFHVKVIKQRYRTLFAHTRNHTRSLGISDMETRLQRLRKSTFHIQIA